MKFLLRTFLFSALLGLIPACTTPVATAPPPQAASAEPAQPIRLTVAATNDLHGWVAPRTATLADGSTVTEGGLAALAGYVRILREENPGGVLLLDAGDIFQGTLVSNLTEGEVVISAMNLLGYSAAALGNHEFDYGPVGPSPVVVEPGMDPFGALRARLAQARFPILASNVYQASDGARPDWMGNPGTVRLTLRGIKIGLVGLITPTTPMVTNPVNVASLRFAPLIPETQKAVARLRAEGAEVVVGIAHAGGKCEQLTDPKELSTCDPSSEIFQLLQGLPEGTLDAVVAGHTHAVLGHLVNGMPVIESAGMGKAFGVVELWVDPVTRKVLPSRTVIQPAIPICEQVEATSQSCDLKALAKAQAPRMVPARFRGQPVVADPAITEAIAPALAQVEKLQRRPLGVTNPRLLGRRYEAESALGSLLADALRELDRADVALLNSGGLRSDLRAGEVRYGDFYEVIPFDNTISTLTLTGEELLRLLHVAYGARKGVFQQSGLKLTLSRCPGERRLQSATLANGKPIIAQGQYRVVMPDFLARGGDGLEPLVSTLPPARVDLGEARPLGFRDALVTFLSQKGRPLQAPPPGRTTLVDDRADCAAGATLDLHASP